YEPATDTWSPIATGGQPSARQNAAAVWTGSEWIVWGGETPDSTPAQLDTGGRYDPALDLWTATSRTSAPTGRALHRATWTGDAMIVFGGSDTSGGPTSSGGRYVPASDSWLPVSAVGAPDPRYSQSQAWDGGGLIVWGGQGFPCCHVPSSGARYD